MGEAQSCHRQSPPASAGMHEPLTPRAAFAFAVSGSRNLSEINRVERATKCCGSRSGKDSEIPGLVLGELPMAGAVGCRSNRRAPETGNTALPVFSGLVR